MPTFLGMPVPMLRKQFVARVGPKTERTSFHSLYQGQLWKLRLPDQMVAHQPRGLLAPKPPSTSSLSSATTESK